MWREQAITEWSCHVISVVACCHGAKLRALDSDRNKMVLWTGCECRARCIFHTKNVRSVWFVVKRGDVVATSPLVLGWLCNSPLMECVRRITPLYTWREQAIIEWLWCRRVISADIIVWTIEDNDQRTCRVVATHDLYCCLLPQCEALRTCRSGFQIATVPRLTENGDRFLSWINWMTPGTTVFLDIPSTTVMN